MRGKGLGGGHANLDAGPRYIGQAAFAHHGAGGDIANGQGVCHALGLRMAQRGQGVGGLAALGDGHHQGVGVGHRVAVAVFAGHFNVARYFGDALDPVLGHAAAVVAGAAGQDQHRVDSFKHARRVGSGRMVCLLVKQLGGDGLHALQGVGNGARLLEDFFLHVVAVGAELGRAAVGQHRAHRSLRRGHRLAGLVKQPVLAQLQVHQIALFQVDDLVGHTGQGHRVAGQEVLLPVLAHAQNQRRAGARTDHALGLVLAENGNRIGALQLGQGGLDGLEQVALIQAVDQVGNHLGVGLAVKHIAARLQGGAQFIVVFDDAVVHQGHAARPCRDALAVRARATRGIAACAMAEMGMRVVHGRCAMGGPAGVGNAQHALQMGGGHLLRQLGHARSAAGAAQAGCVVLGIDGDTARVIAPVFQALQALYQHGNNIAGRYRADDATHMHTPKD